MFAVTDKVQKLAAVVGYRQSVASRFPVRPSTVHATDTDVACKMTGSLGCVTGLSSATHILWSSADVHEERLKDQLNLLVMQKVVIWQQQARRDFHVDYLRKQLCQPSALAGTAGGLLCTDSAAFTYHSAYTSLPFMWRADDVCVDMSACVCMSVRAHMCICTFHPCLLD